MGTLTKKKSRTGILRCTDLGFVAFVVTENGCTKFDWTDQIFETLSPQENRDRALAIAAEHGLRVIGEWAEISPGWDEIPVATGPTPTRTIRIDDQLWDAAKRKAAAQNTNVSAIVVKAIEEFVNEESNHEEFVSLVAESLGVEGFWKRYGFLSSDQVVADR